MGAGVSARAAAAGLGAAEVLGFCAAGARADDGAELAAAEPLFREGCGAVSVAGLTACGPSLGGKSAPALAPVVRAELDGLVEVDESHVDDSFKPPSGVPPLGVVA